MLAGDIIASVPHRPVLSHRADQSRPPVTAGWPASLHFMNEGFPDRGGGAGGMNGDGGREERNGGMEEG